MIAATLAAEVQALSESSIDYEDMLEVARALLASNETPGDLWEANDIVSRALRIRPADGEAWMIKAQVFSAAGDETAALAAIEKASRLLPRSPECHYWHAAILSDLDRVREALRAIDRAFACMGDDDQWIAPDLYCEKALLLAAEGRRQDAEATCRAGLERHPDSELLREALEPFDRAQRRAHLTLLQGGLA